MHLHERDCTLQRRHLGVVVEAPAFTLRADQRTVVTHAAVRLAEGVQHRGAGTIEAPLSRDGAVCFLELKTQLQVEDSETRSTSVRAAS